MKDEFLAKYVCMILRDDGGEINATSSNNIV